MPRITINEGVTDIEESECPGNSSQTSTDSSESGTTRNESNDRKPVPSTEHRSTETQGSSTASSAVGRSKAKR